MLASALQETLDTARPEAAVVGTLRRDQGTLERFHLSAAEASVRGAGVDWALGAPPAGRAPRAAADVRLPAAPVLARPDAGIHGRPGHPASRGPRRSPAADGRRTLRRAGRPAGRSWPRSPPPSAAERLLDLVRTETALVLGHDEPDAVTGHKPFRDLGLDSLTAVDLRNRLGAAVGGRLPATLVFDYPSPEAVAGFLADELADGGEAVRFPSAAASLDYLEAALASDAPDGDAERAALRPACGCWPTAGRPAPPSRPAWTLDAATDQDLFDLLDQDLESF